MSASTSSSILPNGLESLRYTRGSLSVIDQLKIPHQLEYIPVKTTQDTWSVIRLMQVRGAPLIAIVAVLGLAVDAYNRQHGSNPEFADAEAAATFLKAQLTYLRTSRPTAVNLFTAAAEMDVLIDSLVGSHTATQLIDAYIEAAEYLWHLDVQTNKSIGKHGAEFINALKARGSNSTVPRKLNIVTICNTGSLATAGYGTALGVIRHLHFETHTLNQVYALETRPYNQGARLTAFECVQDGIPATLITDSMAAYLMQTRSIDAVVIGADRVAANGDTANKIGSYMLAVLCKHHNIPFFVAAPTTTLDLKMSSGSAIHVEERPPEELTSIMGHKIAPDGISVWNPSFDVTPHSLITGIITELGVATSSSEQVGAGGVIDLAAFIKSHTQEGRASDLHLFKKLETAVSPSEASLGFKRMSERDIAEYVLTLPAVADLLSSGNASDLTVTEVGDGNLNFVYIIKSSSGGTVVAKQALPYVRCVGESWPLSLERAVFEHRALVAQRALAPEWVPKVYHFDNKLYLIVMEFVPPPNLILRKHLIAGTRITTFAPALASFCARTLFGTSALQLTGPELRQQISFWSKNTGLCALTEQVIFTDPYTSSPLNHWTTPQLDTYARALTKDNALKVAITHLKEKFLTSTQALIHGDLHTGSVMCSEGQTFVIDPEFAFYGPMGFDVGALLANLFLAYFAQAGYDEDGSGRTDFGEFILQQVQIFYEGFEKEFVERWTQSNPTIKGDLYPTRMFDASDSAASADLLTLAQSVFMRDVFIDSIGFCGAKMIRRIVGIAHVADLETIANTDRRSLCEKRALLFARTCVMYAARTHSHTYTHSQFPTIQAVIAEAKTVNAVVEPPTEWPM